MQHYCSKPGLYANPTCPASLVSISPSQSSSKAVKVSRNTFVQGTWLFPPKALQILPLGCRLSLTGPPEPLRITTHLGAKVKATLLATTSRMFGSVTLHWFLPSGQVRSPSLSPVPCPHSCPRHLTKSQVTQTLWGTPFGPPCL